MFKLLQHQDAASFPASSALALGIEGPHGATRIIASRGDCANDAKGHGIESRYSSVGASADRDDSVAAMNHTGSFTNRVGAGGACRHWGGRDSVQIMGHGDLAGRHIGDIGGEVKG